MSAGTQLEPGDVITVPLEVARQTGFRASSRLVIRRGAVDHLHPCKSCGAFIKAGELYAGCSEYTSDRCVNCVAGWPVAQRGAPHPSDLRAALREIAVLAGVDYGEAMTTGNIAAVAVSAVKTMHDDFAATLEQLSDE